MSRIRSPSSPRIVLRDRERVHEHEVLVDHADPCWIATRAARDVDLLAVDDEPSSAGYMP